MEENVTLLTLNRLRVSRSDTIVATWSVKMIPRRSVEVVRYVSSFLPDSLLNADSFFQSRLSRCTVSLQQFRLIASETRLNTLSLSVSLSRLAAY